MASAMFGVTLEVCFTFQDPFEGTATHLIVCRELKICPRVDGFRDSCTGIRFGWAWLTSGRIDFWIGDTKTIEKIGCHGCHDG